jgi:hypothetical protein
MFKGMFSQDIPQRPITDLNQLNAALMRLNPSISGISVSMFQTRGVTLPILNAVIAASPLTLYHGMKRAEVLDALKAPLANAVNTHAITFTYDTHGDKHFPGGPPGTKFTGSKLTVNPQLVALIQPEVGRIRRDANGRNQTYYLTVTPKPYSNGMSVCIQVDYSVGLTTEGITYHGYPDSSVHVHVLSRTKGGTPVPP